MKKYISIVIILTIVCLILLTFGIIYFSNLRSSEPVPNAPAEQKTITSHMVEQHAKAEDCWTYIGGQVFNATMVIANNQQYREILLRTCGTNGTSVFTVQKYTDQTLDATAVNSLREQLAKYYIGYLAPL